MIREHEVPAWHRFCLKVALFLVAVLVVSIQCGVENEQRKQWRPCISNARVRRLTVRDYFAAKAMQGWLAGYPAGIEHPARSEDDFIIAELSYLMADAMLKAREKV